MEEPSPEPLRDAEAAGRATPSATATTAARALALGAALTKPAALAGLEKDLQAIGVERTPRRWGSWEERIEAVDASDRVLARYGALDEVTEAESRGRIDPTTSAEPTVSGREVRVDLWRELSVRPKRSAAIAWLRLLMTGSEPVTAAAGAAALSAWQRPKGIDVPRPLASARTFTEAYASSTSPLASAIASAGSRAPEGGSFFERRNVGVPSDGRPASLMVHGTAAYAGTWWFPGGDFHAYVKREVRTDLFAGRNAFSWSGAYRGDHRRVAAERLAGWAKDTTGGALNAVFAHSYGGVIALSASTYGLRINDLVLLSTPVENVAVEWRNIRRATSLRIHLDLVLLAARRRQRFTENVEENHLPFWFWHHGDSHSPGVWEQHDCARVLGLRGGGSGG